MLTLTWRFRSLGAAQTILEGRKATEAILRGSDDRLIVVVGYVVFFFPTALPSHNFLSDPARFMMSMQR
jgi:phospho-2-dehydro-3-deoxyheptonate aldolase